MRKEVFSYINSAVTWLYFVCMATGSIICLESKKQRFVGIYKIKQDLIGQSEIETQSPKF